MKLIRFLLFPFAVVYNVITGVRNVLFNLGILKATSFSIPVIAVGNLNVGGTGKTPQIEYLIRLLKEKKKLAVLSRGYKRKTKGFLEVQEFHTAIDVGDEPLQFFKKFKTINVAVDANRVNGVQQLLKKEKPPEVVLLDDAFQHRKIQAGFYILLTKYGDLFSDDFLLPTGNLREARSGAKRANIVVVTKCPKELSNEAQESIIEKLNLDANQKVFFSTVVYDDEVKGALLTKVDALKDKEILLVTGIANPDHLLVHLKNKGIKFKHMKYPDHHHFTDEDLKKIAGVHKDFSSKNSIILTTEKDYVRLENKLDNLCYLGIKNTFLKDQIVFDSVIQDFVCR